MKTLIVYATKYGAAREAATRLAAQLPGAEVVQLQKGTAPPDLAPYDAVAVISSVYAGMLRGEAKEFCQANAGTLAGKHLALLTCQASADDTVQATLEANLPAELVQGAAVTASLGGQLDSAKLKFIDKTIFNAVAKKGGMAIPQLNDEAIARAAAVL